MKKLQHILFCIICFIAVGGCAISNKQSAKDVWHSFNSSPEQLVKAVNVLIPTGTRLDEVKAKLGTQGVWNHWHGGTINITNNEKPVSYNLWTYDYARCGGFVSLRFEERKNGDYRFLSAGYSTPLTPKQN